MLSVVPGPLRDDRKQNPPEQASSPRWPEPRIGSSSQALPPLLPNSEGSQLGRSSLAVALDHQDVASSYTFL